MEADKLQGHPHATEPSPAAVDVVIVSADMADMTLDCVRELAGPPVAQTIVVDNAFDPQAGSDRDELARSTTVVALDERHGFAAANNRGLAHGSAPYVLLLNSDILVQEGAVELL
ncbi:MAG TPA: glycosyltransferase, partial [Solirubrobacteraceae bacterium]|nr:glycosyltransferase [Solirubrobacteraceae bacterium]